MLLRRWSSDVAADGDAVATEIIDRLADELADDGRSRLSAGSI